jgi:hypothetical protein
VPFKTGSAARPCVALRSIAFGATRTPRQITVIANAILNLENFELKTFMIPALLETSRMIYVTSSERRLQNAPRKTASRETNFTSCERDPSWNAAPGTHKWVGGV